MQLKPMMLFICLVSGFSATTGFAAQISTQVEPTKDTSIIKNVAASLRSNEKATTASKQSTLDQLLRDSQNRKLSGLSSEESMALLRLNNQSNVYSENPNKKFSLFIMRLFGG